MNKAVDISTKKLISLAPNNWAKWVTGIPDIVTGEILNTEFQWISRQSDVVIQAESPQYGKFLILNELQLRYTSSIETSLEAKFGSDGLELMSQISLISDLEQLKEILRRIVVANTIQDLRNVL